MFSFRAMTDKAAVRSGKLILLTAVSLLAFIVAVTSLAEAAPENGASPFTIDISAAPESVEPGDSLVYTVELSNMTMNEQTIAVTNLIPEPTTFLTHSVNADYTPTMGMADAFVSFFSPTFAADTTAVFTFSVMVDQEATGQINNFTTFLIEGQTPFTETTVTQIGGESFLFLPIVLANFCSTESPEPNNTPGQADATSLAMPGSSLTASFCNGDSDDWYRIELANAQAIQINLTVDPAHDLDLFLYADNMFDTILASSNISGEGIDEKIEVNLAHGIYYIRVFPFAIGDADTIPYQLNWQQLP